MSHDRLDYATRMRALGFRVTPQRQLILDAICAGHGHTTLEEIAARVRAKSPAINRATIYRTLDFLQMLHLVVALEWDGQTYYEIAGAEPHHHLICRECGRTEPLERALLDRLTRAVQRRQGFTVDMDHVTLSGVCARCRRKTHS